MADCELIEKCIFFNDRMGIMPATAEVYKKMFCRQNNATCARYMIYTALGRENVPPDLFPNEQQRAVTIIRERQ